MAARAFSERADVHRDEITIERRVRVPGANAHDAAPSDAGHVFDLLDIDEPFRAGSPVARPRENLGEVLDLFRAHLRAQQIADHFLPLFEAEALAFRTRFERVPSDQLDAKAIDAYLEEARAQALPERALRNRRIACDAFLGFLRERGDPNLPPSPGVPSVPPPGPSDDPSDRRRATRVAFLSNIHVDTLGNLRCSDLSVGGMYVETVSALTAGVFLNGRFKLRSVDPEPVEVTARVAFVHPQLGAGIEFVKISRHDAKRIADFVAEADEDNRPHAATPANR